jgi:hypothetical protein
MNKTTNLLSALLLSLLASACGDDDESDPSPLDGGLLDASLEASIPNQPDGGAPLDGGQQTTPQPARFALVTQLVPMGDQATSYLTQSDSLEGEKQVGLEGAPQVLGRALGAGEPGSGVLFVGSGSSPEIARYELQADNSLKRINSVSLQSKGVAGIGEYAAQIQIVSSTKAYYFDSRTAQIVVWNPTTLTVTSSIDVKELTLADALLTFTSTLPIKQGSLLVMPVGWRSSNNQKVVKQAAVIVVDSSNDSARILKDERCGYVRDAAKGADGRVYLATEAWGSAVHRVNAANAPEPCLLRLQADLSAFDASYYQSLNALAGGAAGTLVQARSGKAYVRVLDEAAANVNAMSVPRALASQPVWNWAEITLGDTPTVTRVPGAQLGAGSLIVLDMKERRFVAEVANDGSKLRDLTSEVGGIAATTTGLTFSAVQLR